MQTRDEQEKRAPGIELRQRAEAQMRDNPPIRTQFRPTMPGVCCTNYTFIRSS
jgi:hypothetical protein